MKNYKLKSTQGKELHFQYLETGSILTLQDMITCDFEFHYRKEVDKLTLFREFHIESTHRLTAQLEQALFNYLASFEVFQLCYEDGITCLSLTIENPNLIATIAWDIFNTLTQHEEPSKFYESHGDTISFEKQPQPCAEYSKDQVMEMLTTLVTNSLKEHGKVIAYYCGDNDSITIEGDLDNFTKEELGCFQEIIPGKYFLGID